MAPDLLGDTWGSLFVNRHQHPDTGLKSESLRLPDSDIPGIGILLGKEPSGSSSSHPHNHHHHHQSQPAASISPSSPPSSPTSSRSDHDLNYLPPVTLNMNLVYPARKPVLLLPGSSNNALSVASDNPPRQNITKSLLNTVNNSVLSLLGGGGSDHVHLSHDRHASVSIEFLANRTVNDTGLLEIVGVHGANDVEATVDDHTFSAIPPELFYRHSFAMTMVYCVAYLLVFGVGLVGNCFVVAVVWRVPRMRTVTNYFIVNLAVADILVIVFCLPATLMSNIFVPWMLGWVMCKTVPYVQGVAVAASVYSLIAVSLDRFLAIWFPLKCQITKRRARLIILVIWIIALTTTIPWALFFDLVAIFPEFPAIQLCLEVWPPHLNGDLYFLLANLICCYLLPMILISLCYILIWIKVWKRHIPTDTKDAQMEKMQQKSKVKVVKMLIVVVIIFVLSWLPLYAIFARIKLGGEIQSWEEEILPIATPIAQWLGSSNSCINPILYAFFNNKFRRGFAALWKSKKCCSTLRFDGTFHSSTIHRSSYYISSVRVPETSVAYIYNNTGV